MEVSESPATEVIPVEEQAELDKINKLLNKAQGFVYFRPPPRQCEEEVPALDHKVEVSESPATEVIPVEEQAELDKINKLLNKAQGFVYFRPPPRQCEEEVPTLDHKVEVSESPATEVIPVEEQAELDKINKLLNKAQGFVYFRPPPRQCEEEVPALDHKVEVSESPATEVIPVEEQAELDKINKFLNKAQGFVYFRPPPRQCEEEVPALDHKVEVSESPATEVIPVEEQAELDKINKLLNKAQGARNAHKKMVRPEFFFFLCDTFKSDCPIQIFRKIMKYLKI